MSHIAVIGGGVAGLTASIRLAQKGHDVQLWEAAPQPGGRTGSYLDSVVNTWVDRGPHMLVGAYTHLQKLMNEAHASSNISFQTRFDMPIWRNNCLQRLKPSKIFPVALSMLPEIARLSGKKQHTYREILYLALQSRRSRKQNVQAWIDVANVHNPTLTDLLEVLCLAVMNENLESADAGSFQKVLKETFHSHQTARIGWFTTPMNHALIEPLCQFASSLGVSIRTRKCLKQLQAGESYVELQSQENIAWERFDKVLLALPAWQRDRLLGNISTNKTSPITNIHLWFDRNIDLGNHFIALTQGMMDWWLHISDLHHSTAHPQHICGIVSGRQISQPSIKSVLKEVEQISQVRNPEKHLVHSRVIVEKRATVLVRQSPRQKFPPNVYDCGEDPSPGELPATVETAIRKAEQTVKICNE